VLDALTQVSGVKRVSPEEDAITISLLHAADVLPEILRIMQEAGIVVSSLTVQQPNLEAVFLHLTGQRLTVTS
jgi:ABC-2 type transport system ATP-binding protein